MSLDNLPDIEFCSADTDSVEQAVITTYEGIVSTDDTPVTLYPGDPVRLFLEALAAIIIQQRNLINYTGQQNLLKYAAGDFLDHLGTFTRTDRLAAAAATATVRFSMDAALGFDVVIPAGTRVSPDGQLVFETTAEGTVSEGDTYADITVQCQTAGDIGNGFVAGQITRMVDPVGYITSVSNTTTSSGGADEELDDRYRQRIHTVPESFSVAGPSGAYEHWAKSAHQDISDVAVYRTSPLDDLTEGQLETILIMAGIDYAGMDRDEKQVAVATWLSSAVVNVCPLLSDGEIPDTEMLDLVEAIVDDRSIRPLTDQVLVVAPDPVSYDIDLTYYISDDNRLSVSDIQAAVSTAVDEYRAWQRAALGRDINPGQLIHMVIAAGAYRVDLTSPVYTALAVNEVAGAGTVSLTYGGLESD